MFSHHFNFSSLWPDWMRDGQQEVCGYGWAGALSPFYMASPALL